MKFVSFVGKNKGKKLSPEHSFLVLFALWSSNSDKGFDAGILKPSCANRSHCNKHGKVICAKRSFIQKKL